jgi:hypothetical protein
MRRIILACALAGILSVPAKADETLKFRQVQHTTWVQSQQVGDVNGHLVGAVRQSGLIFNSDGSLAGTLLVIGTFDSVLGSEGTADGYGSTTFTDGSELWMKHHTIIKYGPKGQPLQKGTSIITGGKGRYAGAKGDATYDGEQTQSSTLPGEAIAYFDAVFNIKK